MRLRICRSPSPTLAVATLVPVFLLICAGIFSHKIVPSSLTFFDALPQTASASTSEPTHIHADPEPGRALAENTALRLGCATWQRRDETHALRMQAERDETLHCCAHLERKLCELVPDLESKLRSACAQVIAHSLCADTAVRTRPTRPHAPVTHVPSRPLLEAAYHGLDAMLAVVLGVFSLALFRGVVVHAMCIQSGFFLNFNFNTSLCHRVFFWIPKLKPSAVGKLYNVTLPGTRKLWRTLPVDACNAPKTAQETEIQHERKLASATKYRKK
ncbi:hypothetical protein C8J57DRAFT_1721777 [Mycena rebaudengoi]|nr:hypothetical protein C8J57DRAFT_1721777 [Mycena rebaudengoi]